MGGVYFFLVRIMCTNVWNFYNLLKEWRETVDGMDNICCRPCSRSFLCMVSVPIGCGFAGPCHGPVGKFEILMPGSYWWDSRFWWLIRKALRCPVDRRRIHFRCSGLGVGLWLAYRVAYRLWFGAWPWFPGSWWHKSSRSSRAWLRSHSWPVLIFWISRRVQGDMLGWCWLELCSLDRSLT